jgi:hypothetical protein
MFTSVVFLEMPIGEGLKIKYQKTGPAKNVNHLPCFSSNNRTKR